MKKKKLMNHLKKAVTQFDSRPLLQCVQYHKNGNLYCTDSHKAIRVRDFHDGQNEILLNMHTLNLVEGYYPDVERLMNMSKVTCEIEVSIPTFIKAMKPFADKSALNPNVKMVISKGKMVLTTNQFGESEFKVELPLKDTEGEITLSANPFYVLQALDFSKDAEAGIPSKEKKDIGVVRIKFNSPIYPFMMTVGNYDYLVTPVRTY